MERELFFEETRNCENGELRYRWYIMPEIEPVRGNAIASGEDDEDREYEDAILRRLDNGDLWAWCIVECECTHVPSGIKGRDTLGGCSYLDAEEFFTPSGYADDMRGSAGTACEDEMNRLRSVLCKA